MRIVCPKCGIEREDEEAPVCPICRMPETIDLSEFGGDSNIEKIRKGNEKLIEKQRARTFRVETDYDSIQSLTETRIALSENIGILWKQIALLNNHIDGLKRVKYLIIKEIKAELKDL